MHPDDDPSLRSRLSRQGEDALGRAAQELLANPLVTGAVQRALGAREKAAQAQEVAMGALNLPSAADLERLTRRLRSVSQRLEGLEDGLDRVEGRIQGLGSSSALDVRLGGLEAKLDALLTELGELRGTLGLQVDPLPREQERLRVDGDSA